MKRHADLIENFRDACLLVERKSKLERPEFAQRLGISERHLFRYHRLMKGMGADVQFCRSVRRYYFANDFHFDYGTNHLPSTADEDARFLADLPAFPKGDEDFPVHLYNMLRNLARIHFVIKNSVPGTSVSFMAEFGLTRRKWKECILTLRNLGAVFTYSRTDGHFYYENNFWIGLRVGVAACATEYNN